MLPVARRYALEQLDRAVEGMQGAGVACCIHLGDIVDFHNTQLGVCPDTQLHHSEKALRAVLGHFDRLGRPTLHLLGVSAVGGRGHAAIGLWPAGLSPRSVLLQCNHPGSQCSPLVTLFGCLQQCIPIPIPTHTEPLPLQPPPPRPQSAPGHQQLPARDGGTA
jgi:hypothetical protein